MYFFCQTELDLRWQEWGDSFCNFEFLPESLLIGSLTMKLIKAFLVALGARTSWRVSGAFFLRQAVDRNLVSGHVSLGCSSQLLSHH